MSDIPHMIKKFSELPIEFKHRIVYSKSYPTDDVAKNRDWLL